MALQAGVNDQVLDQLTDLKPAIVGLDQKTTRKTSRSQRKE